MVRAMLRVRRGFVGRMLAPAGAVLDRAAASDPGLLRLLMASRGTSAVFLTTVAAVGLAHVLHVQPVEFAAGITLSLMAPFFMREPNRVQRQRTLLTLALPAAGAAVATTLLHGQGRLGDTFFLVLVFVGFLLQARSPRAIAIGLMAVIVSYVGLYLELPPATLPVQLLSVVVAVPVTWIACFVLLPIRQVATLRRTVRAVQGRAAAVLHDGGALAADDPASVRRLRRSLARLNEAALAADDQLALLYPVRSAPLRLHLMDLELAAARLAQLLLTAPAPTLAAKQDDRRAAVRLRIHERRLRQGRWTPRHTRIGEAKPRSQTAAALADIARAASELGQAGAALPVAAPPAPVVPPPPGPLAWRVALRVTLASAIAMAGGMALSPQRWFWAVITTYVVFLNTRSRGDTVYKGVQRLIGTLLGLVAGLTIASLLAGDGRAESAVLLACVFGMYYLFLVSYTLGIFCVTVLLGLLYSQLGASVEPLLVLRLEETAIGAAAAILVAVFVLPLRTRDQVKQSGTGVLRALAAALGVCRRALAGEAGALPVPAMRAVDRQVADLRLALLPLIAGRFMLRRTESERPVPALLDCVHWARMLAVACLAPDPAAAERLGAIERRLVALADGERPVPEVPADRPPAMPAKSAVTTALDRLEDATATLTERLAIGALHGFRLEG